MNRIVSLSALVLLVVGLVMGSASTAVAGSHGGDEGEAHDAAEYTNYDIDPIHSSVVFRIKHLDVGYVFGMFLEYDGDFVFDPEDPESAEFNFTIQTDSVFTNVEDRDDHLRSGDFFAAEEYPEITFESTSVTHRDGDTYEVTGDLTMRGHTEEITMVADETGHGEGMQGEFRRGFNTTFAVNRMDFGVDFMPDGLGETVRVMLSVQGVGAE